MAEEPEIALQNKIKNQTALDTLGLSKTPNIIFQLVKGRLGKLL